MPYIPSEEEYEARGGGKFTVLGEDWYVVRAKDIKIERKPNPYDRTEAEPNGKMRDTAAVKFDVISFEDGTGLIDNDGNETSDRLAFDFLEIEKMGLKPKPSKARKYTAATLDLPLNQGLQFDSWEETLNKPILAHIVIKKNGKNGIDDYRAIPLRKRGALAQATAAVVPTELPGESLAKAPAAEVDVLAEAKKIFADEEVDF
jgi:hypothetical protein